jgi:SAM-dependent methyltransferase
VNYIQGDSQTLEELFHENSADVIINIESSHCYGDLEAFFRGVASVLKEDGVFLYADFRQKGPEMDRTSALINRYFKVVAQEDITKRVLKAMEL